MKKELTTRQWRTHDLILRNSEEGRETTQREIYENYPYAEDRKDGYVWNDNPKTHDHCSAVWADVDAINASDVVHKVIICNNFVYKMAENEEEVRAFINGLYWNKAMAKLWRYSNLLRKVRRSGQTRLSFDDESKQKEYFETYIRRAVEDATESEENN